MYEPHKLPVAELELKETWNIGFFPSRRDASVSICDRSIYRSGQCNYVPFKVTEGGRLTNDAVINFGFVYFLRQVVEKKEKNVTMRNCK